MLLIVFSLALSYFDALAYDFEVDGIYYNKNSNKATVTYGGTYSGDVTIPETVSYDGTTYSVTSIGDYAFNNCTSLTSVTIPNSVTSIGDYAFYNCTSLTSVEVPSSVTTFGAGTFQRCSALSQFTGSLATSDKRCIIKNGVLYGFAPSGLTSYSIPSTVTSIGAGVFDGCKNLSSITIPTSVTSIGKSAFYACEALTSITLPSGITKIDNWVFKGCINLTSVSIQGNVTTIGSNAFYNCIKLASITLPNTVTSIGNDAFGECSALTSITIPNSVTSIGNYAFSGCSGLTEVTIPESVTSIGNGAFDECSALTSITIPNSVTSIGDYAFNNCTSLTSVTIPNSVTSIGDAAFSTCLSLTSVDIPNSVTSIGYYAFNRCLSLTSVDIPNSVTSIGDYVFINCSSLTEVTIPESVTSIGNFAFMDCSSLRSVTIPNSVTSIGQGAFAYCSSLTEVTIPNSVTSIGINVFGGCSSLTSFNGKFASEDHRCLIIDGELIAFAPAGVTQYNIPESVTSIDNYAFQQCSRLTSISIPNSVTSIGNYAFYLCARLSSITVENPTPTKITLGSSVFYSVPTSSCVLYVPKTSIELYRNASQWSAFTNIDPIPVYTLNDATVYDAATGHDYIDIEYTRNFTNNTVWQCLYIPFDMSFEEWEGKARVAKFNNIHEYYNDVTGELERTVFEYVTVTEGNILPNKPYLIKPETIGEVTFVCENKHLAAAPEEDGFVRCSSTEKHYTLYGTYTGLDRGALNHNSASISRNRSAAW